jgi:hypothetical protein
MITIENDKLIDHTGLIIDVSKFTRIEEIEGLNAALGYYFFSPDTMRWFNSKVYDDVRQIEGQGVAFITSERDSYLDRQPTRLFTVRIMTLDGRIKELSEFQQFNTLRQARTWLKAYIAQ